MLIEDYWQEISARLREAGIPVHHFVLHTDLDTPQRRIRGDDEGISKWRLDHLPEYREAFSWLSRAGQVVDTTDVPPVEVAKGISASVRAKLSTGCA